MKPIGVVLLGITMIAVGAEEKSFFPTKASHVVLAIHGGFTPEDEAQLTKEQRLHYCHQLERALRAGFETIQKSKPSLDAVEASVRVMEDAPEFNAGKGAVFNHDGKNELDASIMEGKAKRAGSVANVTTIKNPISAARAVMDHSKHVMLFGRGADQYIEELLARAKQGTAADKEYVKRLEIVEPSYFRTEKRWKQLQDDIKKEDAAKKKGAPAPEKGTVGAVALDHDGTLAAATSTGGLSNKHFGRVGDSPILGAGTYADNAGAAVSGTGHGEYFIRFTVAKEISDLVQYKKISVSEAAHQVVTKLKQVGDAEGGEGRGEGGVIALAKNGDAALHSNSPGMFKAYATRDGAFHVFIYEQACPKSR